MLQFVVCPAQTVDVSLAGSFPCMAGCYDRGVSGHPTRFKVHEGEVEDTLTRLVWKRCSFGTEWEGKDRCVGQVAYLGDRKSVV